MIVVLLLACKRERPNVHVDPDENKQDTAARDPRIGEKSHVSIEKHELASAGPKTFVDDQVEERTEVILALQGDVVTKLRVTYDSDLRRLSTPKEAIKPASDVQGKSYVIRAGDPGPVVEDSSGGTPTKSEIERVKRDYPAFGRPQSLLPATVLHVGDSVPAIADALRARLGTRIGPSDKLDVRVESMNADVYVFSVTGTSSTVVNDGLSTEYPLKGDVMIRVSDGRLVKYSLDATLAKGELTSKRTLTEKHTYP